MEKITVDNYRQAITEILLDKCCSFWLKYTLGSALDRDAVDALNDVELLREILKAKCDDLLRGK